MKIYFCGSIRGGRDDVEIYRKLVTTLQKYGTVLTEHVSSRELSSKGQRSRASARRITVLSTVTPLASLDCIKSVYEATELS